MAESTQTGRTSASRKPNGPTGDGRLTRLQERGRDVRRDARELATDLEQAAGEIEGFLREQLQRRPYTTLGAAAGFGYVLGGGIPSRLTRILLDLGTRIAFGMAVQQLTGAHPSTRTDAAHPSEPTESHDRPHSTHKES